MLNHSSINPSDLQSLPLFAWLRLLSSSGPVWAKLQFIPYSLFQAILGIISYREVDQLILILLSSFFFIFSNVLLGESVLVFDIFTFLVKLFGDFDFISSKPMV